MLFISLFLSLLHTNALPLEQSSLLTLRTVIQARTPGGNTPPPIVYGPLVLEEWGASGLLQSWTPPCTLAGLSTDVWTEGTLSPRYPWGDQVWFLCRNVPVNSSLTTNPAPVSYMYLNEEGILNKCIEDFSYPNGTNLLNIVPYVDFAQGFNVFYLLGGGSSNPIRATQPRIRVDSGFCSPADTEGSLLAFPQGISINQVRILDTTLYGTGLFVSSSGGAPQPTIFQIGAEGVLPTGTRNPTANIAGFPLVLSVWTDPFSGLWWRTGLNRTAYVALYNNSNERDQVFSLPPSSSIGTLGNPTWSVVSARYEASDFAVYLTNTTHIVKNTLNGLQSGEAYQSVVQAPPGWRYLSAHARNPTIPSASASATASATATASPSASSSASSTATATTTSTQSSSATGTSSSTPQPSGTATSTSSTTSSPSASPTATASPNPNVSPIFSPSSSPTNGTIPVPPNNNKSPTEVLSPEAEAGIGVAGIAAFSVACLLFLRFHPQGKMLWTRQFGKSVKLPKKSLPPKSPITSDVPFTINHNPYLLIQQRVEQLKEFQKQFNKREAQITINQHAIGDRTKKEFLPVITQKN
jgi:hypothetical protein